MILFSLPFQDTIFTVLPDTGTEKVSFTDFYGNLKQEFTGSFSEVTAENFMEYLDSKALKLPELNQIQGISKADYVKKVSEIIQFIKQHQLQKLVFSRRKIISYRSCDLRKSFDHLKLKYPNAFCYLFITDEECWMGAFSEILGKYCKKDQTFETMSLAGTLPLAEAWSEKEQAEQQTVTNFVAKQLAQYCDNIVSSAPFDHPSGNIKHLRTDFKAHLAPEKLEALIQALHPTPAVCGIPKDFCVKAIENFEDSDRELYAGYIKIETAETVQYFVNLRCAKFYNNCAVLFVGGGITVQSNEEKEWTETELKAEAIKNNLVIS